MEQFVVKALQGSAFVSDASSNTHPLNQDVDKPENINYLFDDISYKKGMSVPLLPTLTYRRNYHFYI